MRTRQLRNLQQGAALLLMMLVVLVAATAVLVTRLDVNEMRTERLTESQGALALARDAVIDYATVRPDMAPGAPAMLPCPDINGGGGLLEGETHTAACGAAGVTVMGRLPWRSLGIAPLKDGGEACLWYVVSGSYKDAGAATAELINPDTNGQLQLLGIESGAIIAGAQPDDRPVAMIIAPMAALDSQARPGPGAAEQCSSSFAANRFLDTDSVSGISNASLFGVVDGIDVLATAAGYNPAHNDRIAIITRADLARRVQERHDFDARIGALSLAVTRCVAEYGRNNSGGTGDQRLPWPATVAMVDYRPDSAYDDLAGGTISGRLADTVDDSNAQTGNPIGRILSDCDPAAVPEWTPEMYSLWQHWKDHFFYAVAESYVPDAPPGGGPPGGGPPLPGACTDCLTVNGAGSYQAVIIFSGPRLDALGQVRNAPPIDTDTKDQVENYLEGANSTLIPAATGALDFVSQPASGSFNDRLFCIDETLNVAEC